MKKYTIGIDFGTLSARAVLIDCDNGNEIATSEYKFPHGVMAETDFKEGDKSVRNSAYQHPSDHIDALSATVREAVKESGISPEQVVGIGLDFTSCTMLPVDKNFAPLCLDKRFEGNPHAYTKLWKHHSAGEQAQRITELAQKNGEPWLAALGGKVSSEWMLPKILETLEKVPEIYNAAEYFVESGDHLIWLITGKNIRSSCMAGFKGMWTKESGYPSESFFEQVAPQLKDLATTKLAGEIAPAGTYAGQLNAYGAELLGLCEGTAVSVALIDAHAAIPGGGVCGDGEMMLILGTSACYIGICRKNADVPGICGRVPDGIYPGYVAYEAGQCCVGDMFDWFIKKLVPGEYENAANNNGEGIFKHLDRLAAKIAPGQNRIIALDWWNGSRTPYDDPELTGCLFGMTLSTTPEEIYRALLESVAFGARRIVELFESNGVAIKQLYASGGIAVKNTFFMQILADVLGRKIKVSECKLAGASGSAFLAAYSAGLFETPEASVKALAKPCVKVYAPREGNPGAYDAAYERYVRLSELFAVEHEGITKW